MRDKALQRLPIIAITANSGIEEVGRRRDAGVNVTLFKPDQLQALRDCVARYLPDGRESMANAAPTPRHAPHSPQDDDEAREIAGR